MQNLPRDVLFTVCSYLGAHEVLLLLSTCCAFRARRRELLDLRFRHRDTPFALTLALAGALEPFTALRRLDLRGLPIKARVFDALLPRLTSVEWLSVVACVHFHKALSDVPARTSSLFLDGTRINTAWAVARGARLPQLELLSLRGCHRLGSTGLVALLQHQHTRLGHVNLSGTEPGSWESGQLGHMLHTGLSSLQSLDLRVGVGLPAAEFHCLTRLERLCSLDATATLIDDTCVSALRSMQSLLLQATPVGDAACTAIAGHSQTTLTRLQLLDCVGITSVGIHALASLVQLRELGLKDSRVESATLLAVCAELPQLSVLNLDECEVSDAAVLQYASRLAPLTILNVRHTLMSSAALQELCVHLTRLNVLSVGGSARLTDVGIASVATLPMLRVLDCSYLPLVTAKGYATLRWATLLWKIDLNGVESPIVRTNEFAALIGSLRGRGTRILPPHLQ